MISTFEVEASVTRFGDLLNFGQLFKAFGNNYLPKSLTFLGNFWVGVKIYHFSSEIIFGQINRLWRFFSGHIEWSSLVEGYEHLDWPNRQTCMQ